MKLQEVLDKFTNCDFLLSVNGLWDMMSFYDYKVEKKEEYFNKYKDKNVKSMAILWSNGRPELFITVE